MIITICGSSRFEAEFKHWRQKLALAGHSVFSLSTYPSEQSGGKDWASEDQKTMVDLVYLNSIRLSDVVLILNVGNYVGSSLRREIMWAQILDKNIVWLEPPYGHAKDPNNELCVDNYEWELNA